MSIFSSVLDLIMSYTLGPNWQDSFDMVCAHVKKPLFQRGEEPFYWLDKQAKGFKGNKVDSADKFGDNKVFLEGNAALLTSHW